MTPETQRGVWAHGRWVRPRNPVADELRVTWAESYADDEAPPFGLDGLLDEYCALAQAEPDEVAEFVSRYGVPEVEGAEASEGRESNPFGFPVQTMRAGSVPIAALRRHAKAVQAFRRLAAALVVRQPGDRADWVSVVNRLTLGDGVFLVDPEDLDDWKLGREHLARLLTLLMEEADVGLEADWLGTRGLALEPRVGTFVGLVAVLLAREVGAEGRYECDACGSGVLRNRPPRDGERVYCRRPECKREQQRRNQRKYRARKRMEGGE